jgi:hypothetical protein
MKDDTRPDYLTEGADGSLTVQLLRPADIAGAKVPSLTMREPTVGDQLAVDKIKSTGEREVAWIANLCGVAPAELHKLTMRDYGRLQEALGDFLV